MSENEPEAPKRIFRSLAVETGDRSEKIDQLMIALAKIQARLEPAARNALNPFTHKRYADFSSIIAAAQKAGLSAEGLAISQGFEQDPDRPDLLTCVTLLAHGASDQWITNRIMMKLGGKGGGTSPAQDVVAGTTYARRIGYQSIAGIVAEGEDEDGNEKEQRERGQGRREERQRPAARSNATRGGTWTEPAPAGSPAAITGSMAARRDPAVAEGLERARPAVPENVAETGAKALGEEFARQERLVHLMRELQPHGFKMTKQVNTGRVTFTFPRPVSFDGSGIIRFDELTLERMERLETLLKDQLAARAAGGSNPASAAPSPTSTGRPSRSDQGGQTATEGSRGPRGELFPPDDDVPF